MTLRVRLRHAAKKSLARKIYRRVKADDEVVDHKALAEKYYEIQEYLKNALDINGEAEKALYSLNGILVEIESMAEALPNKTTIINKNNDVYVKGVDIIKILKELQRLSGYWGDAEMDEDDFHNNL